MQRRILVVDDEAYNLLAMEGLLKLLKKFPGLERLVDTAVSGEQCVEMAKNGLSGNHLYCLVFMDLSMRPMDGYQATEALRELYHDHQQPKVVACTGHVESLYIEKAWRH